MEEDFTEESSHGTIVRGDDHSYYARIYPDMLLRGHCKVGNDKVISWTTTYPVQHPPHILRNTAHSTF